MSSTSPITKELLFTYFAGKATALQKHQIESWMEEPENEEFFYECVHEWEIRNLKYVADVNEGIKKFRHNISKTPGEELKLIKGAEPTPKEYTSLPMAVPAPKRWSALLVAASVVILLGLNVWFFNNSIFYKTYQTGYGEISTVTLPDGSKVTLNANSELEIYRFGFGDLSRKVSLKGEANFEIVHTPDDKKFVVLTGPFLKVEVLGTEFNVFARKRATKVGLYKGKVKVIYGQSPEQTKSFSMVPGDLITMDKSVGTIEARKVTHPENFAAWRQGRFIFENTPLAEIRNILEENYGLEIELKSLGLAEQTVSGSFKANSVDDLLQALAETLGIMVTRQDNHFVFTETN